MKHPASTICDGKLVPISPGTEHPAVLFRVSLRGQLWFFASGWRPLERGQGLGSKHLVEHTGDVQDLGRGSVDGPEAQSLEITDAWYTPKVPNHSKQHFTGVPVAINIGEPQPSLGFEAKTIITPYDAKFTG